MHLLTLGCVAPFLAHAVWTSTTLPLTLEAEQAQRASEQATTVARQVEQELERLDALLDSTAVQLDRSADLTLPFETRAADGDPLTSRISIGLLDSAGARVASLGGRGAVIDAVPLERRRRIVSSVTGTDWERPRTDSGSIVNVRPLRVAYDSVALIMARPVTAGRARCDCLGDVSGALIIAITDADARALLVPQRGTDGTVVTVLDTAGATVAGTDARRWRTAEDLWHDSRAATRDSRSTDSAAVGADGIIRTVASAQVATRPWRVIVGLPTLVAARVDTRVRDALLLTACGLLLAFTGLAATWRSFTRSMLRIIAELMPYASRGNGRPLPAHTDAATASGGDMAAPDASAHRPDRAAETAETFALMAALAEFARATAGQPELQSVALARLQQLAGETSVHDTSKPVVPPTIAVTHLRISDDQVRFDTMPPTRV